MAQKRRAFDVWIVESNTVYKQVPFTVITDWAQEGRLLGEDKLRAPGTEKWVALQEIPSFAVYLPKKAPFRAEDQAEALEPVHVDFSWKPRKADPDNDVDMIPLIDVSLVLLVFFMMTASVGVGSIIKVPDAQSHLNTIGTDMLWIGLDMTDKPDQPAYSLGVGEQGEGEKYPSRSAMLTALRSRIEKVAGEVKVNVRANKALPFDVVRDLIADVEQMRPRNGKVVVLAQVNEKPPS